MARYTIEVQHNKKLDMASLQQLLKNELSKKMSVSKVNWSTQKNATGIIWLETDLSSSKIKSLLYTIKRNNDFETLVAKYGWTIPSNLIDSVEFNENETDPVFHQSSPQDTQSHIYYRDFNGKAYTVGELILLFVYIALFYSSNLKTGRMTFVFGLILMIVIIGSLASMVLNIRCDDLGMEIRYFLIPKKKILWKEIQSIELVHIRNDIFCIQTNLGRVELPLSQIFDLDKRNKLIKTIITRTGLCYFDGFSEFIYRRPEIL